MPFFETFDVPDAMQSRGVREQTTVATQALLLLNNKFVRDQAVHFAARVVAAAKKGDTAEGGKNFQGIVEEAYWLAFSRNPTKEELELGVDLLSRDGQSVENFCHILLTLNEFAYVD